MNLKKNQRYCYEPRVFHPDNLGFSIFACEDNFWDFSVSPEKLKYKIVTNFSLTFIKFNFCSVIFIT